MAFLAKTGLALVEKTGFYLYSPTHKLKCDIDRYL